MVFVLPCCRISMVVVYVQVQSLSMRAAKNEAIARDSAHMKSALERQGPHSVYIWAIIILKSVGKIESRNRI